MSAFKKGQKSGLGKYSDDAKLNQGRALEDTRRGTDLSKPVYDDNDSAGVRGGRPGRDKTGT